MPYKGVRMCSASDTSKLNGCARDSVIILSASRAPPSVNSVLAIKGVSLVEVFFFDFPSPAVSGAASCIPTASCL